MSGTADRKTGYAVMFVKKTLSEIGGLLVRAHEHNPVLYILKNQSEVCDPMKGSVAEIERDAERYTEGYTYSARAEVRWKAEGCGKEGFNVLVLTEDFDLAASFDESIRKPDGDSRMEVTLYEGYEDEKHVSSVNFWPSTETRLPGNRQYGVNLFRSYAVYRNAKTHAAEFTRLIPE